jgi:hypothetical protein
MAEILFCATTRGPAVGTYKIGDIVVIRPDGWPWGLMETKAAWLAAGRLEAEWNGDFFLLKLPGVSVATIEYLIAAFPTGTAIQGARRLWKFDYDSLSTPQKNSLASKGGFTADIDLTSNQVKAKVIRKDTLAAATW